MESHGLESIYTIPNKVSKKILERTGFVVLDKLHYLVRPLRFANNLKQIDIFADLCLSILSKELFLSRKGYFEELIEMNGSLDLLWEEVKQNQTGVMGDHDSDYINWRYFNNPLHEFRILTYREHKEGPLLGYIVYTEYDSKLEIFNITSLDKRCTDRLLQKIVSIGKGRGCNGVYIAVSKSNRWFNSLKAHLFLDTKYDMRIYSVGNQEMFENERHFFGGDRNI
jgi:hypothetical protein